MQIWMIPKEIDNEQTTEEESMTYKQHTVNANISNEAMQEYIDVQETKSIMIIDKKAINL